MDMITQIAKSLIAGEDENVGRLTRLAMEQGIPPKQLLDAALIGAMSTVGARFKAHEIFLPDVLLAAKAMYAGMDALKPLLAKEGVPFLGKVIMGTVQGDLHDIGKNLVGIMLRGAGFEVLDLGNDVAPSRFVDAALAQNASIIGMSALLTTTMPVMGKVVELIKERKLGGRVKTIIGGAPVSERFAREIGADAYGFDAASAVDCVKGLTGRN